MGNERWDCIVVGSGLGGLACAAYLAAAGRRTLVLESHYVAGGNSQVFRRRVAQHDFEFDVGIHYIGECGPEGKITRILRGVGIADRVRFRELDPDGYTTLVFPDFTFRIPTGWERYRERLLATFPAEASALAAVLDIMQEVAAGAGRLRAGEIDELTLFAECPAFLAWGLRPVTELFAHHGLSLRASAVLLGESGDYGVRPSKTPVVLQSGLTDHYMRGAFYPEGGGQVLAARLVEAIEAYGGEVRTQAPVQRIRCDAAGRVAGVTVGGKPGRPTAEIDAPVVVSNADLKRTCLELVGRERWSKETLERVERFRMSLPLFCCYLVLDADRVTGQPNTNYFLWGSHDIESIYAELEDGRLPDADFAYVTVASRKDPTNTRMAPAGWTNLQIMTLAPREYALWHATEGPATAGNAYHRDRGYRDAKAVLMERLIHAAERVLPGIGSEIYWKEAASPLTQERFTRSTGGTSYGIEFAIDQMGPMRLGPQTEIEGLFLTGASTPSGHGIGSVLRGGVATAGAVLGRNLLAAAWKGEVMGDPSRLPAADRLEDAWQACRGRGRRGLAAERL